MRQRSTAIRAVSEPEKKAEKRIRKTSPSRTKGQAAKFITSPLLYYLTTPRVEHPCTPPYKSSLASAATLCYIQNEGWSAVHGFPSPQKPLLCKERNRPSSDQQGLSYTRR
jgi:hypothetical protein